MGKLGSTLLTFLFSIPITAVGFMAIFGVPQIAPLNASPSNDIVIRDPYAQNPWGQQSENRQELGSPGEFPQNSSEAPTWGTQPQGTTFSGTNSAPAWGETRQQQPVGNRQSPIRKQYSNPFGSSNPGPSLESSTGASGGSFAEVNNAHPGHHFANPSPQVRTADISTPPNPFANHNLNSNHPNTTETSAQMLTWTQASARLAELGIKYHLERGGQEGTFLFVCLFQPASSPHVMHRFEAEENDPLLAVNKVIGQVENWLQEQYRSNNGMTASRF